MSSKMITTRMPSIAATTVWGNVFQLLEERDQRPHQDDARHQHQARDDGVLDDDDEPTNHRVGVDVRLVGIVPNYS